VKVVPDDADTLVTEAVVAVPKSEKSAAATPVTASANVTVNVAVDLLLPFTSVLVPAEIDGISGMSATVAVAALVAETVAPLSFRAVATTSIV
jgi:hypothetical protein